MKIPSWKTCECVEVRKIVEWKDGCVYQTQFVGYAYCTRLRKEDEVYSSISTSKTQGKDFVELAPWIS